MKSAISLYIYIYFYSSRILLGLQFALTGLDYVIFISSFLFVSFLLSY